MRCFVVSCVYPPEPVVSAQTSQQIAQNLSNRGHEVKVIAPFPNRPGGKIYQGFIRRVLPQTSQVDGLVITRSFSFFSKKSTLLSRFLENISFGLTSGLVVLMAEKPDVIYSNTWPIFATGIIWVIAKMRGIPLVISVQDLFPESLYSLSKIDKEHLIARLIHWLDQNIARGCAEVMVISDSFFEIYLNDRKVSRDQIHVIPNWVARSARIHKKRSDPIRKNHNIPNDAFLMVYGGNIGEAAGVEDLIEVFNFIPDALPIYLLIAGDGSSIEKCKNLAAKIAPNKILFRTPWPNDYNVLVAGDVLVLPTRNAQSMASVPSKLIAYLLSGRPVLAAVLPQSDTATVIEQANCGWVVSLDDAEAFSDKIMQLMILDESLFNEMGLSGRQYALDNFTTEKCLPKAIDIIESAQIKQDVLRTKYERME